MPGVIPFPSQKRQDRISERIRLVHVIAHSIFKDLFPPIREDDLRSVGFLALVQACDEETSELHVRYAIRNAILDDVRRSISRHEKLYGLARAEEPTTGAESSAASAADLARALAALNYRERRMIELRLEGRTQAEAGEMLNISQVAASRLEARAIAALRARMAPNKGMSDVGCRISDKAA
jgi:RNA polymerase sigma factor (sigma-70 family)